MIVACDLDPARLALAAELGATHTCAPEALRETLKTLPACTHAIDTVGTQQTIEAALSALAPRGACATVALRSGANPVTVSQSALL